MSLPDLTNFPVRVFCFLVVLMLPLAVYAKKGEVILLGLGALVLLVLAAKDGLLKPLFRKPVPLVLVLILVWSAASTFWAIQMRDAWDTWTSITLLFVGIVVTLGMVQKLSSEQINKVAWWAVYGLWAALALLAIELLLDMPLARIFRSYPGGLPYVPQTIFNASLGMAAIIVWPSVTFLWQQQKRIAAVLTIVVAFIVMFLGEGDSAKLALVVATVLFGLAFIAGSVGSTILAAVFTIGILVAPVLPLQVISTAQMEARMPDLKQSAMHRIKVWEFTAERIAEKPFTGWGLDSSRNIPGGNKIIVNSETYMPLHPHNGVLQMWLELGAPGAALLTTLILICLMGMKRLGRLNRAGATAALMGAMTVYCLSFGIWQNWWIATLGLMALVTLVQTRDQARNEEI